MSDPTRLLQDAPSELEAELLRSVATERPTFEHRVRVRQAMGLAPGGSLAPGSGAGSRAASKRGIAGLVAAGAIAALLTRGAFRRETANPSGATIEMVAATATATPTDTVAESQALPSAGAPPSPTPRATAITPSHPARDSNNTVETIGASDIHAQILLIDEARAAIRGGDQAAALRTLDLYASKYPGGAFGQEATVTRIDALDQSGNHARAASLARVFLAKHPASAHARRLERIAGN